MTPQDFIPKQEPKNIEAGEVTWQSPSNIALVKYWGKKENQIPANPSISFTLDNCQSTTTMKYSLKEEGPKKNNFDFKFFFEGKEKDDFKPKILTFFERIESYCPYLKDYQLEIRSENSFPHSSGIASSASGMSALALCVMSLEKEIFDDIKEDYFNKKASFLARLGSGSASRSIEGPLVVWGEHENIAGSSDIYGEKFPYHINEVFKNYQDTILLVDKGEKQVSSTVGHNLMHATSIC